MFTASIPVFLILLQLLPSCVTATNNGSCLQISSIANTNTILYTIPNSNPPTALSFSGMHTPQFNPSVVLLSMVENMQPVCRHFSAAFPSRQTFYYGRVKITLQNFYLSCGPLTYNNACTVLRGLAEFMVLQNQFYQCKFQIWVNGFAVGDGQIDGINRVLPAASAAGVATS